MKRSIVYLDDDPGCLDVFEQTLNDEYEVRTATTPDEARRMLTERVANIIVSDQSMPAIKGEDFLREVAPGLSRQLPRDADRPDGRRQYAR